MERTTLGMSPRELVAALTAQGFAMLPSVFPEDLVARVRAELDAARLAEEARFGAARLREVGQDGYVSDCLAFGPAFLAVLESDAVATILEALFGGEARLYVAQGILLDPGRGGGIWPRCWHADMYGVGQDIGDARFRYGVNCLLLVDDVTRENGATEVLPGSHRLRDLYTQSEGDLEPSVFRAAGPAGSLLVLDGATWHSAGFNRSDRPRRVVKMMFTRPWIRPQLDYAALAPPALAAGTSPRLRRLLGLDEPAPPVFAPREPSLAEVAG
jgi:hypothetical protein